LLSKIQAVTSCGHESELVRVNGSCITPTEATEITDYVTPTVKNEQPSESPIHRSGVIGITFATITLILLIIAAIFYRK